MKLYFLTIINSFINISFFYIILISIILALKIFFLKKSTISQMLLGISNLYALNNYFLVTSSPWPLYISISSMGITFGLTDYMHNSEIITLIVGFIAVISIMTVWFRDVIRESLYQGHHTKEVQKSLTIGMILFIVSEVMFFFFFFLGIFSFKFSSYY